MSYLFLLSFLMLPPPPISTLFPYTTLFRSYLREDAAGLRDEGVVAGIEGADVIQPLERQDQLAAGIIGDPPAAVAGVAGLRHHADPFGLAQREQPRDLRHRARQCHGQCPPAAASEMVDQEGCAVGGFRQHPVGAEDVAEPAGETWRRCCQWVPSAPSARSAAIRSSSGGWLMNSRARAPAALPSAMPKAANCGAASGS